MKQLSVLKHSMLKKFGGGSKNLRTFTTGTGQNLAPDVAQRNLDDLIAAGFLRAVKNDSFAITRNGLLALDTDGKASADKASERVRPGAYVPPMARVREGADDHLKHASLPMGAQIQINSGHDGASDRLAAKIAALMGEAA